MADIKIKSHGWGKHKEQKAIEGAAGASSWQMGCFAVRTMPRLYAGMASGSNSKRGSGLTLHDAIKALDKARQPEGSPSW
jgi:hypothetical protein